MWACTTHIAQSHLPAEHYFEKHFNRIISIRSFKNTPTGGHIKGYCDEMSLQTYFFPIESSILLFALGYYWVHTSVSSFRSFESEEW